MAMILNIHDQVDKVINEIERNYSKGLTFTLSELSAVQVVEDMSNFSTFLNMCRSQISNRRVASYVTGSGINAKFRKI
ncbi:MAG: hypothetical protein KIC44_10410 [Fusobacterium periodonticum]|nr:hypothetical protein [Fusobacterium periodonticum]